MNVQVGDKFAGKLLPALGADRPLDPAFLLMANPLEAAAWNLAALADALDWGIPSKGT